MSFYRLRPDQFADYRDLTGLQMEQRALDYRFKTLLVATDQYLQAGHPLSELNCERLIDFGLCQRPGGEKPIIFTIFMCCLSPKVKS